MGCCKCESQAQVCQGGETERHKHRNLTEEKDLLKRLNRIEGQVRGVKAMVEDERYCVDILNQVSAVQAALNSFSKVLLSNHIKTCVVDDIEDRKSTRLNSSQTCALPIVSSIKVG